MVPLRLRIQAFGPYVSSLDLDFAPVLSQGIFLITGPTGAGKTTLFDAMCFALYGESSGAERTEKNLRSQLAPQHLATEVEFTFELGEWEYRVFRSLAQKRGKNQDELEKKADLYRRRRGSSKWEGIATKYEKVKQRVSEVLGFKANEFRQVILIPQGKFRELLTAKAEDRRNILNNLFDTGVYGLIQEALNKRAKDMEGRVKTLDGQRKTLCHDKNVEGAAELEARIGEREKELARLQEELGRLKQVKEEATRAREKGEKVWQLFEDLKAARARLSSLREQEGEIEALRALLEKAKKAAQASDLADGVAKQEREVARRKGELEGARKALDGAKLRLDLAADALKAKREQVPEREEKERDLMKLSELEPMLEALEQARDEVKRLKAKLGQAEGELKEAQEWHKRLKEQMGQLDRKIEGLQPIADDYPRRAQEVHEWDSRVERGRKLEGLKGQLVACEKELEALLEREQAAATTEALAKQRYEDAFDRYQKGVASALAAGLVAGQPCPVCGSREHPAKAKAVEGVPGEAELKKLAKDRDAAAEQHQRAARERAEKQGQRQKLQEQVDEAKRDLAEYAGVSVQEMERHLTEARKRLEEAEKAQKDLRAARARRKEVEEQANQVASRLESLGQLVQEARSRYDKALAQREERERNVPQGMDIARWKKEVAALTREVQRLKAELDAAEKSHQTASEEYRASQTKMEAAETELARAQDELETTRERFVERLRGLGFDSREAWEAARRSREEIDAAEQRIEGWNQAWVKANHDVERLEGETKGLTEPDMAALIAAEEAAQKAVEESIEAMARTHEQQMNDQKALEQLREIEHALAEEEDSCKRMTAISAVAAGTNGSRITLEEFVLSFLLDQVLGAANERLQDLSHGRFKLCRREEPTDKRRKEGLSLDVFDSYSARKRPVETLSGGESFQAALALALGLADVVQQKAGGVRLDTLFIDEGFGNLDATAREDAWNHLITLSGNTRRLVGIISHMEDLRNMCPTRLDVSPGLSGSTAQFRVGG